MTKKILILACTLMLGGCALPVPLQIASWAVDGLLFITTEKTAADHGVSLIAQRDCAMVRVVTEGAFCRDDDPMTAAVAREVLPPVGVGVGAAVRDTIETADNEVVARGDSPLPEGAGDEVAYRLAMLETAASGEAGSVLRDSMWQQAPGEEVLSDETAIAAARWQAIIDAPSFFDHPVETINLETIPVATSEAMTEPTAELKAQPMAESTTGLAADAPAAVAGADDVQRSHDWVYHGDAGLDPYLQGIGDVTLLGGAGNDVLAGGAGGGPSPPSLRESVQDLGREPKARRRRSSGRAGARGPDPPGRGARRFRIHVAQGP